MITKTLSLFGSLLAAALFAGCTHVPHDDLAKQAEAIGYGTPPPANYQDVIKAYMEPRLKDAPSAIYKFVGEPEVYWVAKAPIDGGQLDVAGYKVTAMINAKNGYGGYTGFETYRFIMRDGAVIKDGTAYTWH